MRLLAFAYHVLRILALAFVALAVNAQTPAPAPASEQKPPAVSSAVLGVAR